MRTLVLATAGLLAVFAVVAFVRLPLPSSIQERFVSTLTEHLNSDVELGSLEVSMYSGFRVHGEHLVLRQRGRADLPPLFEIGSFSVQGSLIGLMRRPMRIHTVRLDRLLIHVPPRRPEVEWDEAAGGTPVIIERLVSTDATLLVHPDEPDKPPHRVAIHRLTLTSAAFDRPMSFHAVLTNPVPEGLVDARGEFGPWNAEEPRFTPVAGTYTFTDANLDTIRGIGGVLSSHGQFSGVLERLAIQGETTTPDFTVDIAGHRIPLNTRYSAIVDGTNGDTILNSVEAQFGGSSLWAGGSVMGNPDGAGRTISLDVMMEEANIEDVLKLAVRSATPPLTGVMGLRTKLVLPPGPRPVADRLQLEGEFRLDSAWFTNVDVQKSIEGLSRRGRGDPDGDFEAGQSVVSKMHGRFRLEGGVLHLSTLTFDVDGASVRLSGEYALRTENLDFNGDLLLDVPLSRTTTGIRSLLLRLVDPLFRRGSGAWVPIRVSGTREEPSFGLDYGRALIQGR